IFLFPQKSFSSINYISNINAFSIGPTTRTMTLSSNANKILIFAAAIMDDRAAYNINSVSYGSQYFTLLTRTANGPNDGTGITIEMWYLLNPSASSGVITFTQPNRARVVWGVVEYSGVNSIGAFNSRATNANSISTTVSTQQARSWIAGFFAQTDNQKMNFSSATSGAITRWELEKKQASSPYIHGLFFDLTTTIQTSYSLRYNSNKTNDCGIIGFELKAAPPVITSCVPSVGYIGGGQAVTITGANFDNGCTVLFGSKTASVTYINSNTLRVTTPSNPAGPVNITVINLDSQQAIGNNMFTYSSFLPPVITSCNPTSGTTLGGNTLTVYGSNFINGCTVTIGGYPATDVVCVSSNTLTMKTPANALGTVNIMVTNPDGQYYILNNAYTYTLPPPQVLFCVPATGLTTGGQTVTVIGKYFVNGATVRFGTAPATGVTFLDSTSLRVITPANPAGPVDVIVRNPDAQSNTLTNGFTYYLYPPPAITSIFPPSGTTAGGQVITVNGSNFRNGCTAYLDNILATSVNFINSSQITLVTPPHSPATVDLKVVNPDGQQSTLLSSYTYIVPPVISQCIPSSGKTTGGYEVTLYGSGFRPGCTVTFDGIPATVTRISNAELNLMVPPHSEGPVNITVLNTDWTKATLTNGFVYDSTPPVINLNSSSNINIPVGSIYTETATASDNVDGNITTKIVRVILDNLGNTVSNISTTIPATFTIIYNVSDTAGNTATQKIKTVNVVDTTPPEIFLNGGGANVSLFVGSTYIETATAIDNIDGDITSQLSIIIIDHLGNTVPSVSTSSPETYTIYYNVSDSSGNSATQKTRIVNVINKSLVSITITKPAAKLVYMVGESLDISGLEVTGTFDDSSSEILYIKNSNILGFNSSTPMNGQILTININGITTTYTVDIVNVTSISITKLPNKLVYDINEPLDISGIEVYATYSNNTTGYVTITASNISGFDSSSAQTGKILTVTYYGKTDTFAVDIVPTLVRINITSLPYKLIYDIGETLNITGLVVTGTYTDNSTKIEPITLSNITGFNSSYAEDDQVLTINYNGKTTYFTVDIIPSLVSIAITQLPYKLVFNVGDTLNINGLIVKGTYTDGSKKIEPITLSNISGFNSSVPVTGQVLTITYMGKTATYTIDIVKPLLVSIAVTTPPNKTTYIIGEPLDITGMVVTGTYDDLSTKQLPITESNISGFNSSTPIDPLVLTVTYEGKSTTFTVKVIALPPVIYSCTPSSGPVTGGTFITLEGDNFVNGCTVTIGGAPATGITFIDENTLTMYTPARPAGPANIVVTNPDGQYATGVGLFYYGTPTPTPTISATFTRTRTHTITLTSTININTSTPTFTPSSTSTQTRTGTRTPTYTNSPTFTISPTFSNSPTITLTNTITPTHTQSPTFTASATFSNSPTITQTSTSTPTNTMTMTATITETVTITPTAIVKEVALGSSFCWPQPARDELNIVYGLNIPAFITIYIYNAAGTYIANINHNGTNSNTNTVKIDVSKFSPGIYYYIIKAKTIDGGEIKFKVNKFIIER
ncbi:MAG: IPT/TIG domain-containing protein, partial [Candidatus Goldbacteria bacterium]|nr:IPT/TIG domain-containing protein [Candidatus Goldiibacteriota bacterium]